MKPESEEAKCDRLIRALGGEVVSFSVGKRAQIANVPDRRYRLRGVAFWAEIKRPPERGGENRSVGDKLSVEQFAFLEAEYRCGQLCFAGDAQMLRARLGYPQHEWREQMFDAVLQIVKRGYRTSTKRRPLTESAP